MSDRETPDPSLVTPFAICTCATCGPPWRNEIPEPDRDDAFVEYLGWHSWMALCPKCGNKRCPGAADHTNICSGSNAPGQSGSLYPDSPFGNKEGGTL